MSWRSSVSDTWSDSQSSFTSSLRPSRAASIRMPASVTRRAKRSGRIGDSARSSSSSAGSGARTASAVGELGRVRVALDHELEPLAGLLHELRRALDPGLLAEAEHPGEHLARVGVVGLEHDAVALGLGHLAGVAEVAQREPVDPVGELDAGAAGAVAELPVGASGVRARVELLGAVEVVLGLGGVADLPADSRDPEDAHVVALVRVADQVELPAAIEQVVGVDLALLLGVAADRVVVEQDRLAAEDRRLDLREPLRELAPARAGGDRQRDGALLGRVERARLAPGELLQGEPQRLGVGELAVEQRQRHAQRAQLLVRELDRRQVEVLGRQRVVLGLVVALGRLVDLEVDAERLELRPVGVEATREGLVVHLRVALHVLLDLEGRDGPPLRHQERDQAELPDELLGVLRHGLHNDKWVATRSLPPAGPTSAICDDRPRRPTPPARPRRLLAQREVRGRRDAAVEVRPAGALGERLLDPVEAAQVAAEVVDEVHERGLARARDDGAAVLELAVVAEDDVEERLAIGGREALDLLDLAPDPVVAERDLAEQLAGVGELDRAVRARRRPRSSRCRAEARR